MAGFWHTAVYKLILLRPFILTYIHLLVSALFPIVAGAHASLSRPSSTALPSENTQENKLNEANEEDDDSYRPSGTVQRMEGLTPGDAIVYPILIGCMLSALFFLINWLEDPTILNRILNLYMSAFGILSVAKLATDSIGFCISFVFPRVYLDQGIQWEIKRVQECALPMTSTVPKSAVQPRKSSPLPGFLSRVEFSDRVLRHLWALRGYALCSTCYIQLYVKGITEATIPVRPQNILGLCFSIAVFIYFNFLNKPWWLTNVLGFSFCYNALQVLSPTTFWTGTLILVALFTYDIYFVFFTPIMITVATSLDIPVKLLFPRPSDGHGDPQIQQLAMLGLGDIVLPGLVIGLALRFDLYLFYLRKQTRVDRADGAASDRITVSSKKFIETNVVKPQYFVATGNWGERFWLGPGRNAKVNGAFFPKTYFYAGVSGYIFGMICTLITMHIFKHGQPALLYLVPSVLAAIWGTASIRGESRQLWDYTEAENTFVAVSHKEASCNDVDVDKATQVSKAPRKDLFTNSPTLDGAKTQGCLAYIIVSTLDPDKCADEEAIHSISPAEKRVGLKE